MILSEPVEGVFFVRLFTFSPHTRASQLWPINDRPEQMPSPLNYQLTYNRKLNKSIQDHHGRFLAGKTATVVATSAAHCSCCRCVLCLKNAVKTQVLAVLLPMVALSLCKYVLHSTLISILKKCSVELETTLNSK